MPDTLAEEIAELPRLNRAQLRAKWRSALKKEPPAHLRKQLLVPMLAYKLQEQAYGGLMSVGISKYGVRSKLRFSAR